jgi:hypothetical protein
MAAREMSSKPEISPVRRFIAVALGVVTLLCTLLWLLTLGFVTAQCVAGVYNGPELGVGILVLTFPPTLLCTIIALFLVGPRRCKLAWISLCVYIAPIVITFGSLFAESLWNSIKRHL